MIPTDWQIHNNLLTSITLDSDNIMQLIGQRNYPNHQKTACGEKMFEFLWPCTKYCYRIIDASASSFTAVLGTPMKISQCMPSLQESAKKHKAPEHLISRLSV